MPSLSPLSLHTKQYNNGGNTNTVAPAQQCCHCHHCHHHPHPHMPNNTISHRYTCCRWLQVQVWVFTGCGYGYSFQYPGVYPCYFLVFDATHMEFLGIIIGQEEIKMDKKKLEAIEKNHPPQSKEFDPSQDSQTFTGSSSLTSPTSSLPSTCLLERENPGIGHHCNREPPNNSNISSSPLQLLCKDNYLGWITMVEGPTRITKVEQSQEGGLYVKSWILGVL